MIVEICLQNNRRMQQKSEYLNAWAGLVDPLLAKGIMDINYTRDGYKRKGVKH